MKITHTPPVSHSPPRIGDLSPGTTFIPHGQRISDASAARAVFIRGAVALSGEKVHVTCLSNGEQQEWLRTSLVQPVEATLNIALP